MINERAVSKTMGLPQSSRLDKYRLMVEEKIRQSELEKRNNTLQAQSIFRRLEVARMMLDANKKI